MTRQAAALLSVMFAPLILAVASPTSAQEVLTYHNDAARTGQNLNETILTPGNVSVNTFGKLFTILTDGKVDAQPLYVSAVVMPGKGTHNVLFVATEHDSVYAFGAATGITLWHRNLLKQGEVPSDNRNCSEMAPEIGITATPVIDHAAGVHGTIYVLAMSKSPSGEYFQRLHALDVATGEEEFGGPVDIHATFPGTGDGSNNGSLIFNPKKYKSRPGLLLVNNVVYTSWGSHCDSRPYTGWIIGYNETSLQQVNVLDTTPNGSGGSLWSSGAGLAADVSGNIYFLVANGTFDTTPNSNGFPDKGDFGNGFLKVSTLNDQLAVTDYFDMFNTLAESTLDVDLGSGGALVLPDMKDSQEQVRHLAVGAGKDRKIYLVDRDNMGKFHPTANKIYQELSTALAGPEYGMPAYFSGTLYYGAVGDAIRAFPFLNGRLLKLPSSITRTKFRFPGATPSISANGTTNGIVWAAENTAVAVLHAYDAGNLARELYNSNQATSGRDHFGAGNKFITPTIANGRVYVGTTTGVGVFGLR